MITQYEVPVILRNSMPTPVNDFFPANVLKDIYKSVQYFTKDQQFWTGCKSCVNYNILLDKKCKNCYAF